MFFLTRILSHKIHLLGTRSRQQHSRNLGSKKGNVFKVSSHSKSVLESVVHTKKPRTKVYVAKAEKTKIHDNDQDVVVAKPPKVNDKLLNSFKYTRLTTLRYFSLSNPRSTTNAWNAFHRVFVSRFQTFPKTIILSPNRTTAHTMDWWTLCVNWRLVWRYEVVLRILITWRWSPNKCSPVEHGTSYHTIVAS